MGSRVRAAGFKTKGATADGAVYLMFLLSKHFQLKGNADRPTLVLSL
jgi:hypothetical protein